MGSGQFTNSGYLNSHRLGAIADLRFRTRSKFELFKLIWEKKSDSIVNHSILIKLINKGYLFFHNILVFCWAINGHFTKNIISEQWKFYLTYYFHLLKININWYKMNYIFFFSEDGVIQKFGRKLLLQQ